MPRKVEPPHRGQNARVTVTPRNGTDWIDRERVVEIAAHHGIRDGYDLYTALDHAVAWYLQETSRENDAPTREQRRQVFRQIDEHTATLKGIIENMPFSMYGELTQYAPDGGWKSRLLGELRVLQNAVAPLRAKADKKAKRGPNCAAREHFLESLIRVYEEGTGKSAKVYWDGARGGYGGATLSFAFDCTGLIPQNESGTNPRPFVSEMALAEALMPLIRK